MTSLGLLVLRLVVGGLLAGHGAQKLFGFSGGPGPEGTAKFMSMLGLKPEERWAYLAGASEFLGGSLIALGLLNPLGPIMILGPMATATITAHRGKPIWVTAGGAELPITNMAVAAALILGGPGRLSLDALFGTRVPWWFSFLALAGVGAGVMLSEDAAQRKETAAAPARAKVAAPATSGKGQASEAKVEATA
jgi:putative oxidoreductase